MSETKPMGIDSALFQLRTSGVNQAMASTRATKKNQGAAQDGDLEKASRQFESLLLNFMIREMRATVPESSLFPPSMAQDIFTSMLDEQYADAMAERGGIGLNKLLMDQLGDANGGE